MLSYWRKRRSATKTFNIVMLDGSTLSLQLESRCTGADLIRRLLENQRILSNQEIFGLTTLSDNCRRWLNLGKVLKKQIPGHSPYTVHLCVWAYPRDHHSILQSITRHQLYLQVRQDLLQGRLKPANENVCGSILGHVVQREVGDFEQHTCGDGYIHEISLLPAMTTSLEETISRNHRANRGMSERDAEEGMLNLAQGEFTYGTHTYTVQDSFSKRSTLQLSVCPAGVRVTESISTVITYEWEVIERVAHKGKQLYLDLVLNTKTPPPQGPTQFTCASSQLSANLCYWCGVLREFYCHGNPPSTQSRLRRFFSSRRSMRRRPVVEPSRRLSGSVDQRRSSFGNDSHYTRPPITKLSPSANDSEAKGLVVYGESGLADQAVTSNDITTIAEVVVHNELKDEPTEPQKSHDMNHFEHVGNHVSHNQSTMSHDLSATSKTVSASDDVLHGVTSHDPTTQSHDLDSPEIKSLSNIINHRTVTHESPQMSHDLLETSHDSHSSWIGRNNVRTGSHEKSHDYSARSLNSPQRSHDSYTRSPEHSRSHDSPHHSSSSSVKSHDSHRKLHDSPRRSYNSPHRSRDHSRRSNDNLKQPHGSPHWSHDNLNRSHDSPFHTHNGFKRYELGPQRKSSRESSPIIDSGRLPKRRSSQEHYPSERATSLTRHVVPEYSLAEDHEWAEDEKSEGVRGEGAGQDGQRYIDPKAKPKNRIRLSLPDTSYHDLQGRRGTRLSKSSRRARNTSIASTTNVSDSMSQPTEGSLSMSHLPHPHPHPLQSFSSKLGSIASLEAQANLAELSQADSYVDPHMRSFVFQASQLNTATEL